MGHWAQSPRQPCPPSLDSPHTFQRNSSQTPGFHGLEKKNQGLTESYKEHKTKSTFYWAHYFQEQRTSCNLRGRKLSLAATCKQAHIGHGSYFSHLAKECPKLCHRPMPGVSLAWGRHRFTESKTLAMSFFRKIVKANTY